MSNDTTEQWRDIPGYEGYYRVSRDGEIFSIRRNKLLRQRKTDDGYLRVTLTVNYTGKGYMVHRLVMMAFIGTRPADKEVNHINGNKADNRRENLEYLTRLEHAKHSHRVLGVKYSHGDNHPSSKLNEDKVAEIKRLISEGVTFTEIGRKFGVHRTTIRAIAIRKHWRRVD